MNIIEEISFKQQSSQDISYFSQGKLGIAFFLIFITREP